MKKIKPLYIYLIGIILTIIIFYFITQDTKQTIPAPGNISGNQMPQDQVHKGLQQPPGATNVMPEVMQKMEEMKKDVDTHPNDTLKVREYADFLAEAHQKNQALIYYQKILNINPKRTDILFTVAYINYSNRNFAEAEKDLKQVLNFDRKNVQAYYNLGAIAASQGDKIKAEQIWTKLIMEFPQSSLAPRAKESITQLK